MTYADSADADKASQEESNYRRGLPTKHCGVCIYYEGDASKSCSMVEGPISGFGISDIFKMQSNPFGSRLGPQESALVDQMMSSPPDQSPAAQAQRPSVQIGSRNY
jgi:hypothetical protein